MKLTCPKGATGNLAITFEAIFLHTIFIKYIHLCFINE